MPSLGRDIHNNISSVPPFWWWPQCVEIKTISKKNCNLRKALKSFLGHQIEVIPLQADKKILFCFQDVHIDIAEGRKEASLSY
jgi:predicted transcriptional regulator